MLLSRLLAAGGALTLLVALSATGGGCTVEPTTVAGPASDAGFDGVGSSSSGGSGSSGSGSGGFVDATACLPGDVTTYAPQYKPATGAYQGDCSGADVGGFFDACLAGPPKSSTDSCNSFQANHPGCAACILTPDSASKYGPLIGHGSFVTANVAGCLELVDATTSGLACAKAVQALAGCELLACEANCDVHDIGSLNAYETCATTADQAGCGTYASASSCVQGLEEAGDAVAQCLAQDFATFYGAAAQLFCGPPPPPSDAGAPPYDAGSPSPDGSTASD